MLHTIGFALALVVAMEALAVFWAIASSVAIGFVLFVMASELNLDVWAWEFRKSLPTMVGTWSIAIPAVCLILALDQRKFRNSPSQ
jgi:hypothetical protein